MAIMEILSAMYSPTGMLTKNLAKSLAIEQTKVCQTTPGNNIGAFLTTSNDAKSF